MVAGADDADRPQKNAVNNKGDLLILARYRGRTISFTKLWSQISQPNRTLSSVPLILN